MMMLLLVLFMKVLEAIRGELIGFSLDLSQLILLS